MGLVKVGILREVQTLYVVGNLAVLAALFQLLGHFEMLEKFVNFLLSMSDNLCGYGQS